MGYSFCRFACGIPDQQMGCTEFYDGVWVWPEGLAHYVECHSVLLPDEFIQTMRSHSWRDQADAKLLSGTERMILKKVGYWCSDMEPNLPDPRALVHPGWYRDDLPRILAYLRAGRNYIFDMWECEKFDEKTQEDMSFWTTWAKRKIAARQPSWRQRLTAKLRKS